MHNVHQADRIHVKDRSRIGIVTHLGWIAGDADQVADAHGRRAQKIGLDAQHIAVAAGVVQNRFDADLSLHEQRQGLITHTRGGARAVRNVDSVHAYRF